MACPMSGGLKDQFAGTTTDATGQARHHPAAAVRTRVPPVGCDAGTLDGSFHKVLH